jgi:hypothetical protein
MTQEDLIHRIENAVLLLLNGHGLKVNELTLRSKDQFTLTVTGWTNYNHIGNITEQIALSELEQTKNSFSEMLNLSKSLMDFTKKRQVEYYLSYDDSGKCSIPICKEMNGELEWKIQLRN